MTLFPMNIKVALEVKRMANRQRDAAKRRVPFTMYYTYWGWEKLLPIPSTSVVWPEGSARR